MTALFTAQTTSANGTAVTYPGGPSLLILSGTFDGCTVKLQVSRDGTTFHDLKDASWTAAVATLITLPQGYLIRAVLSSHGASTSVSATI